ncbi:MAG: DUF4019 domain-containing protein [Desulfuromonadales bacterium]
MKNLFLLFIATFILHVSCANVYSSEFKDDEYLATEAAYNFLDLLDTGEIEKGFDSTSTIHKRTQEKGWWINQIAVKREYYGSPVDRSIKYVIKNNSIQHHPDGKYISIHFETFFENKEKAFELVEVLFNGEEWIVTRYFCN